MGKSDSQEITQKKEGVNEKLTSTGTKGKGGGMTALSSERRTFIELEERWTKNPYRKRHAVTRG